MTADSFFDEQKEQSLIKATIVAKYFDVWANVIIGTRKRYPDKTQKIAYIDLFAGRGRYDDGSQSTPLKILQNAIQKPDIRDRLITLFNDKKESSGAEQGVPSFEYSPADFLPKQSLLFQLSRPLEDLQDRLLEAYAGQTLSMRTIYENHSFDTPYIAANYKEALKNLENDGKITARKPDGSKRKKGTFADDVLANIS